MVVGGFERLTVMVCLAFTAALSVAWSVIICMPSGWTKKMSIFYVIDCGLLKVEIGPGVAQEIVGAVLDQISPSAADKLRNFFRGTYDQQEFKEYMCSIVLPPPLNDPCGIWQNLHWASWTILICATLGSIASISAGLLLYYWCFVKPRAVMRQWIRALYAIATLLYLTGVFTYCMLTKDTNTMPPRTEGTTLGPLVMVAVVLTVLSLLPLLITAVTVQETAEECKNEMLSEKKQYDREMARSGLSYGSVGASYQAAQPLQAQDVAMYQQEATYQTQQAWQGQPPGGYGGANSFGQGQPAQVSGYAPPQQPAW